MNIRHSAGLVGLVLLIMNKMMEEKCDANKAKGILDYRMGKTYETAVKDN